MERRNEVNVNEAMHIYSVAFTHRTSDPGKQAICEKRITDCSAKKRNHLSPINSLYI